MYLKRDKMRVAENCTKYQSLAPVITGLSFMSLSCSSCANYCHGKCSMGLAEKINDMININ